MGRITTGIGLFSGLDTGSLIDQLMAIEARPIQTLTGRVQEIDTQRAAFLGISGQLLALQNSILNFDQPSFFSRFGALSSNESVLTATAGENAVPGSHTLRVHSLVTTHSVISRGFTDSDTTPVGTGTVSIEVGRGRVNRGTTLDLLNGGSGVRRGIITITDRSGATAEIDLSKAQTIEDVLIAINASADVNVRAFATSVSANGAAGDRVVIEDLTPDDQVTSRLIITDKAGSFMAADLGIATRQTGNRVDGRDLVRLVASTPLAVLNDGNGVGRLPVGGGAHDFVFARNGDPEDSFGVSLGGILAAQPETDLRALNSGNGVRLGTIRITDRLDRSVEVDLADPDRPVRTANEVRERIMEAASAAGMSISITIADSGLMVSDRSGASDEEARPFTIEDVTGFAALDLGIAQTVDDPVIHGNDIYRVNTIGDVINAINYAPGNDGAVEASISPDGNAIVLRARVFGTTFEVTAAEGSTAADDLGILGAAFSEDRTAESRRLIAGLNTVLLRSLNGGAGVELGEVSFTDRLGRSTSIDFADLSQPPQTLQDIVDLINADANASLAASVNASGTGIELRDESGGTGSITVTDVGGGSMAADLAIAGSHDDDILNGGNLQLQYVSRQTRLSELNSGRGVNLGDFQITDSTGGIHTVRLGKFVETVGEVIDAINRANPQGNERFEARINDTGDGIVVVDKLGGDSQLTIEDIDGGRSAADLRLAGSAKRGEGFIDGSYEIRIVVGPTNTLDDVAEMLTDAGLQASILNDGGEFNPYSLTITSPQSGRRGALVIDSRGVNLGLQTLSRPQDAMVTIGDETATNPLLITSSSNTLTDVIEGVTMNLVSADDEFVTVNVTQDIDGIVANIRSFVDRYNGVQSSIDEAIKFDPDTFARGPLAGDATISRIRDRLYRVVSREFEGISQQASRLFAVGLRVGGNNRLEFDENKFRETYDSSPELVEQLFAQKETGFGAVIEDVLDELTRSFDGLLARKDDLLLDQQELINDRIDKMNVLLEGRRAQLEAQFVAMESAIAALQGQQTTLSSLALLASQTVS